MRKVWTAVLLAGIVVGGAGCAALPGLDSAMISGMTRESIQEVEGVPFSKPSLQAAEASKARFANVRKIAIIGFDMVNSTSFTNNMVFNWGPYYDRTFSAYAKAFENHGIKVVPMDKLRADKVYRTYDQDGVYAQYLDASGPIIKNTVGAVIGVEGSFTELAKAAANIYLDIAKQSINISTGGSGAVVEKLIRKQAEDFANKQAKDMVTKVQKTYLAEKPMGKEITAKMRSFIRSNGGNPDHWINYLPLSMRNQPIASLAAMQNTPMKWAQDEQAKHQDPFIADLAKSLGVDAVAIIQVNFAWEAAGPSIGLTKNLPSNIIFYDAAGRVMMTPFIRALFAEQNITPQELEDIKKKNPLVKDVLAAAEKVPGSAMYVYQFLNTFKTRDLYLRTELKDADARLVSDAAETHRQLYLLTLIEVFKVLADQQRQQQQVAQSADHRQSLSDLNKIFPVLGWNPPEIAMAQVDMMANKMVGAILKPIGR